MTEQEKQIAEQSWHNGYLAGVKAADGDYKRMPFVAFFDKVHHLQWLQSIAAEYKAHIELIDKEQDNYTCQAIKWTARGDARVLQLNPHHPIPATAIRRGLNEALASIEEEIAKIKDGLQNIVVDV